MYMVHFIFSRHIDIGSELCLELLQESTINALQRVGTTGTLSPDKITIAVQATLHSLHLMEKENGVPAWPSTHDFTIVPPKDDYPTSSTTPPSTLASKPDVQEHVNRVGTILGIAAITMSVLEDEWSYPCINLTYEKINNYVVRKHDDSYVAAYPMYLTHRINLLQACFLARLDVCISSVRLSDAEKVFDTFASIQH